MRRILNCLLPPLWGRKKVGGCRIRQRPPILTFPHKGGKGQFFFAALIIILGGAAQAESKRIASLLPSHTEIIQFLGAEASIVGVSDGEAANVLPDVPRVGGLAPNWEAVVDLKPDLILADVCHEPFHKNFTRFLLPVVYLPSTTARSMDDIFALVRRIAGYVDKNAAAEAWIAQAEARLAVLLERVPADSSVRVYFEIWPKPLQAAGPDSLQGTLLSLARARNIIPPSKKQLPLISDEWVVSEAPDVILHTGVESSEQMVRRPGWSRIPAVAAGRIYVINRDHISRAGPHTLDALEELIGLLYGPEARP